MPDFSFPSMIYLIRFFLLIALGLISGCQSKGQMECFAVIDRIETLDLQRMSRVIDEVYLTLRQMD